MDNILYYCMQKSSLNISSIYLHIWICVQLFLVHHQQYANKAHTQSVRLDIHFKKGNAANPNALILPLLWNINKGGTPNHVVTCTFGVHSMTLCIGICVYEHMALQ